MKTALRENISKIKGCETLVKMKKQSPLSVWFIADKKDAFLIHIVRFFGKSGIIANETLIIKTDLEQWVSRCEFEEGFEVIFKHNLTTN